MQQKKSTQLNTSENESEMTGLETIVSAILVNALLLMGLGLGMALDLGVALGFECHFAVVGFLGVVVASSSIGSLAHVARVRGCLAEEGPGSF